MLNQQHQGLFENEKSKSCLAALRERLRGMDIKLRVSGKSDKKRQSQHLKGKGALDEISFELCQISKRVVEVKVWRCSQSRIGNVFISYAKEIAKENEAFVVLIKDYSGSLELSNLKSIKGDNEQEMFLFTDTYIGSDDLYYIELMEGYVQNKIDVVNRMNTAFKEVKEQMNTFEYDLITSETEIVQGYIYYKGYEGDFMVTFEEKTILSSKQLEYAKEITSLDDVNTVIEHLLDDGYNQVKLVSLISPPKKHFTAFLRKYVAGYLDQTVINNIFESLSVHMTPEMIEESILIPEKQDFKTYKIHLDIYCFKLFNRFIIINEEEVEVYPIFEESLNRFERLILEKEKMLYEDRIATIKADISKLEA